MSGKKPKWEKEIWTTQGPNAVACETCKFRASVFNGMQKDSANIGHCEIYEYPEIKPDDVYFDGAECEFYEKADDKPLALILGVTLLIYRIVSAHPDNRFCRFVLHGGIGSKKERQAA